MMLRYKKSLQSLEALGTYTNLSRIIQASGFSDTPFKKPKLAPLQECRMIDCRRLCAKGGDGGNGCFSFHRSRHDRRGRADGGNGGRGGDVILECSPAVWDLSSLQHHINAKRGGHGGSKNMIGSRGEDKVVMVPVGTVIHLVEGEIPSVVKKDSSTALEPWEIPGTLMSCQAESGQQATSLEGGAIDTGKSKDIHNGSTPSKKMQKAATVKEISRVPSNNFHPQASPLCSLSSIDLDNSNFWEQEKMSEMEAGVTCNDDSRSELEEEKEEMDEEEHVQYNVAELTEPGQRLIVARGGDGGLGNISFPKPSKSPSHRSGPGKGNEVDVEAYEDEKGALSVGSPGSEAVLILELKSIADVGLVGMPNAGKSTLLGALSRAQPRVGHYAFTTLRPNLGNLNYGDFSVKVADIPGLIRGAHENRGLGHAFLRHIERTKVLAYVLDLAAALDGRKGVPPWQQLRDLILELEFYREGMSNRPALVVANKIDEVGADEVYDELRRRVPGVNMFPVCAVLGEGVPALKDGLGMLVSGDDSNRLTLDGIDVE